MSCSAKAAPPGPWNDFTGPATVAGTPAPAAGAAGVGPTWAWLTVLTELSTDWAAVMVRPAWVRPVTKLRREIPFDKYLTTSSLMGVSLKLATISGCEHSQFIHQRRRG